jgi:hypothetical protein
MVVAVRLPVEPRARPARAEVPGARGRVRRGACAVLLGAAIAGTGAACGDDSGQEPYRPARRRDAGPVEFDARVPEIPTLPESDAGKEPDGAPPEELAGEACAVDTNKVYELVRAPSVSGATELAVDLTESRFGVAYVSAGMDCLDALYLAEIQGPLSEPEITTAVEECTTIERPTMAYSDGRWLLAFVDNRTDGRDIWVQPFDPRADTQLPAQRITDSTLDKRELRIVGLGSEGALIAWVEQEAPSVANGFVSRQSIQVRALWPDGLPYAEAEALTTDSGAPDEFRTFSELRLSGVGASGAILGYREDYQRYAGKTCATDDACLPDGRCELGACVTLDGEPRNDVLELDENRIVLEALDLDGKRTRDPWILTAEAGPDGNVDLATDESGGAAVYTRAEGTEGSQVWLQSIGSDGAAPSIVIGNDVLGKAEPERVVGPPVRAFDPSITRLPMGFAVSYRALPLEMPDCSIPGACTDVDGDGLPDPPPDNGVGSPRIRVVFLRGGSGQVNVFDESDVALSEAIGGLTSIEAAFDGRVVITWTDLHVDATTSLYAARLPCLGR